MSGVNILKHEMKALSARGSLLIKAPFFFFMVVTLFPLAIGPVPEILSKIGVGIIIISILLACLFPINQFFDKDSERGLIDHLVLSPAPFALIIFFKILAHWILVAAPLVILSPFVALSLNVGGAEGILPIEILYVVAPASVLFVLIGVLGASLTLGAKSGDVLLALLVVPLYIPVVICAYFATQIGIADGDGRNSVAALYFLYAGFCVALPVVPILCAKILTMKCF